MLESKRVRATGVRAVSPELGEAGSWEFEARSYCPSFLGGLLLLISKVNTVNEGVVPAILHYTKR